MTREDFVLAYKRRDTGTVYCRICLFVDIQKCTDNDMSCDDRYCCCKDFKEANDEWIKFSNQKAIPLVFSDGRCLLNVHAVCRKSLCKGKITECDFR